MFRYQFNPNPSSWNEKPFFGCCDGSIRSPINIVCITFHQSSPVVVLGIVCVKVLLVPDKHLSIYCLNSLLMIWIRNLITPGPHLTTLITDVCHNKLSFPSNDIYTSSQLPLEATFKASRKFRLIIYNSWSSGQLQWYNCNQKKIT